MEAQQKRELRRLFATKLTAAVRMYLETCTHCGTCIPACHAYASAPEVRYSAVGRAENIRKLFKKYFSLQGKTAAWLNEAEEFSDAWMEKVYETAYTCTGCRRCVTYCPFGIDTQQIQSIAKLLLIGAGREPQVLSMLADMSIAKGQSIEETKAAFTEAVKNLEAEVISRWRGEAGAEAIPIGKSSADVLYVALAGKHSIIPAASIMNAAGESWSLSYFEAVNFGAFVGNPEKTREISRRIIDEAVRLGVKEVAICECGTAFRVMKHMMGKLPFAVVSFVDLMARYLREGRIRVDPGKVSGKLTYHDPCQMARNGGVIEEAREVIAHLSSDFVELTPTREHNWCCGGGGGLVAMGEKEFRMKSARVKVEQVQATGAEILTTACENCHTQLSDLNEHYGMEVRVEFLSNLVSQALVPKP